MAEPDTYKGHSFRRTSTTILAGSGASMSVLMNTGGWKSSKVAMMYSDNSEAQKMEVNDRLKGRIDLAKEKQFDDVPRMVSDGFQNIHSECFVDTY